MTDALIIFCAQYLVFLVVLLFIVYGLYTEHRWQFMKRTVLAGVLALALSMFASQLYNNPRPFMTPGVTPLVYHAPGNGFPSDHALLTGTLAAVVTATNPFLGALFWVLALLVSGARVLARVHHAVDIIASFVIAGVSVGVVHCYLRRPRD